jgi:hypothetical protein
MPARVTFLTPIQPFIFYPPKIFSGFYISLQRQDLMLHFQQKAVTDFTPIFQTHAMYILWGLTKKVYFKRKRSCSDDNKSKGYVDPTDPGSAPDARRRSAPASERGA